MKKLLWIFTMMLLIAGCSPGEDFTSQERSGEYKIRKISFDEFKTKSKAFNRFQKTSPFNQNNSSDRIVYNADYGIYYDTDNIIYIERDGYRSYTIPVIKGEGETIIKNLVLYAKANEEDFKVKMMKYNLTEEEVAKVRQGIPFDIGVKTQSEVPRNTENSFSVSWFDDSGCLTTMTVTVIPGHPCSGSDHHDYGEDCPLAGTSGAATGPRIVVSYSYAFCSNGSQFGGPTSPIDIGPGHDGDGGFGDGTTTPGNLVTPTQNPNEDGDEVITTPWEAGFDNGNSQDEECELSDEVYNQQFEDLPFNLDLSAIRPNCQNSGQDNENKQKLECAFKKLKNSQTFKNFFNEMFGNNNFADMNVKFEIVENTPSGGPGYCSVLFNTQGNNIIGIKSATIQIKREHIQNGSLYNLIKTIVHESIHAYLYFLIADCNGFSELNAINNQSIGVAISTYTLQPECTINGYDQHNFMANKFMPVMQDILSEVRDLATTSNERSSLENYNYAGTPFSWDELYKNMSLEGLNSTTYYGETLGNWTSLANQTYQWYITQANGLTKNCTD